MIKYIVVDIRIIERCLKVVCSLLNINGIGYVETLVPTILAKVDDYRVCNGIWDILAQILDDDNYNKLDYEVVSLVIENATEQIHDTLNQMFNMHRNTIYSFEDWIGKDVRLEINHVD